MTYKIEAPTADRLRDGNTRDTKLLADNHMIASLSVRKPYDPHKVSNIATTTKLRPDNDKRLLSRW